MSSSSGPVSAASLLAECARRSAVCWVTWRPDRPGGPPGVTRLVWHAWHGDAVVVLDGDEQRLDGLAGAGSATVTLRSKDTGGAVVTCTVSVRVVPPEDPSWPDHAGALAAARLNVADPSATVARWRREARVLRLMAEEATEDPTTLTV